MAVADAYLAFAERAGAALKPLSDPLEAAFGQVARAVAPDAVDAWQAWLARNQSALSRRLPLMNPVGICPLSMRRIPANSCPDARAARRAGVPRCAGAAPPAARVGHQSVPDKAAHGAAQLASVRAIVLHVHRRLDRGVAPAVQLVREPRGRDRGGLAHGENDLAVGSNLWKI